MNPIVIDNFAFRIPNLPARYRANCSKDFGLFITGETKGMNCSKAEKAGLTRGSFVEMAVCAIANRTLTFKPHYENESFTEIWGIPVAGEMKTAFHENCSELSTFLIHRQSQDKMKGLIETFGRQAFNTWVTEGMPGDANEYAISKASEAYFTNIFRFEFIQSDGNYGPYFYISTSIRQPVSPFEDAALKAVKQIYEADRLGANHCVDYRLLENEQLCLAMSSSPDAAIEQQVVPVSSKQIKGKS